MSVQQFCLRWNNHQPNFISVFSTLLHNETLVDVTLAAEGKQLQAHKVVLSACSSYFQSLFTSNPCQHPIVILKDVQYNHLKTMVDFMYYGEVNVSQEQLPHILKTAEMLKIKGLAEMPDATSLTKSESKTSLEHQDQIQSSIGSGDWVSTESQQQFHQQQQQQHHHQQHQQRRTPSPGSTSPSTRRKRLRKSSTGSGSASTERTSEEQSSIEGGSNINMSQIDSMATFGSSVATNIGNTRTSKESSSIETETVHHESSQESVDESNVHHSTSNVMKSDGDIGNVSQTMPLDITGSSTPGNQTPCPQSQSGVQWTLVDSNYPRFALSTYQTGLTGMTAGQNNPDHHHHHHHHNNNSNSNNNHSNTSNTTTQSSNNTVQMQYQNSSYSPQIISVNPNNLVNNYQTTLSTPTSPQGSESMVQSVYSQGPTPTQSPIQLGQTNQIGHHNNIMPTTTTTTTTTKRKRSINPQGDENFLRALDAVRYGGIGFCKAARLYGVNNRTLWLEYKKRGYPISRPSIKNRIKLEPNMTPPPPSQSITSNDDNTMENYDHITTSSAINMASSVSSTETTPTTTPLMCPPHAHVMSFLDARHVEFPTGLHPMSSRQRYPDPSVNIVNPTSMNLPGLNFNSM